MKYTEEEINKEDNITLLAKTLRAHDRYAHLLSTLGYAFTLVEGHEELKKEVQEVVNSELDRIYQPEKEDIEPLVESMRKELRKELLGNL